MNSSQNLLERRVLVCAPHGRDSELISSMLTHVSLAAEQVGDLPKVCDEILKGAGCLMITEESLYLSTAKLLAVMQIQPAWSDLPIIILTTGGAAQGERTWQLVKGLEPAGNVTLLERPLRKMTLVHAVQVALRSRDRQYEMRALQNSLEARVAERTEELQRLNREAEGFSYTIAHDLRAPLRAIVGACRIMEEDFGKELSPAALSQLETQARAANRLAQLIDDLLRLSKLSREEMHVRAVDLSRLATEVASEIAGRDYTVEFQWKVQDNMYVQADPTLLRLALINLLENAFKFSPQGGTITVACEDRAYFVGDEGIGFDEKYAEKMFRPFERLVNEKEFPGTGIGLANVSRIIERHGGKVWAKGAPGKGAKIYFTLPEATAAGFELTDVRNQTFLR